MNRHQQLIKVATLFYIEELSQTDIAKRLGLSRPTISNLLKEAKDKGIVKITIQGLNYEDYALQNRLEKKYGLSSVLITSKKGNNQINRHEIGILCASLIESKLPEITSLGIGWGSTLYEFVQASKYLNQKNLFIVPLIGGMGLLNVDYHSNHLAFSLAQKYQCSVNYFYAPAIADSIEMKRIIEKSELVEKVIKQGKKMQWAVVGVGNPLESSTYKEMNHINPEIMEDMTHNNVIGDILASFYNSNGCSVHSSLSDRMIGIKLEDLEKIDNVVVLAAGIKKARSVQALLKRNIINHLIIDLEIANFLDKL